MNRYHKQLGFNQDDLIELKNICQRFNDSDTFSKTEHALDMLQQRFDFMKVLGFLKDQMTFNLDDMFEYYTEEGKVSKVVFRVKYTETEDIIIVLARNKRIITAYINNSSDHHKTLDPKQYTMVSA